MMINWWVNCLFLSRWMTRSMESVDRWIQSKHHSVFTDSDIKKQKGRTGSVSSLSLSFLISRQDSKHHHLWIARRDRDVEKWHTHTHTSHCLFDRYVVIETRVCVSAYIRRQRTNASNRIRKKEEEEEQSLYNQ